MRNKCLILLILVALMSSCVKVKQCYISDEAKAWFVDDDKRECIIRDENGIERGLHVSTPSIQFLEESSSSFMTKNKTERESMDQKGYLDYSTGYYVTATAGWGTEVNVDDKFEIGLHGLPFTFSLRGKTLTPVRKESPKIEFTSELLESFEVDGVSYDDVLHIQLVEYELLRDNDPIEIYYAKHYGLIQYTIHYGITYFRLPAE